MFLFLFAKESAELSDVVAEFGGEFHARPTDFFDERVSMRFHVSPFMSCSGVIKSGVSTLRRRFTRLMWPSLLAFARCSQFHVSKMSQP